MIKRVVCLAAVVASTACAGRPVYIAEGERWTLPLVDPLARGELTVPVTIDGKGPYAFVIAPHLPRTVLDDGVAEKLGLYSDNNWSNVVTQKDTRELVRVWEVPSMVSGTFRLRNMLVLGARPGSLSSGGHAVAGIIGADVISASMMIEVDRDDGVVRVAIAGKEERPPWGSAVAGRWFFGQLLLPVSVDGRDVRLALDMTASHTAARGATRGPEAAVFVDPGGGASRAPVRATPSVVKVGTVSAEVNVAEFDDRRIRDVDYDGVLGQDFLSHARVILDAHHGVLWLAAREPDLATSLADRIGRWGAEWRGCAATGCATLAKGAELLTVTPALPRDYQIVVEARDESGERLRLLHVHLSPGGPAELPLEGVLAEAASLRVVDAAPAMLALK